MSNFMLYAMWRALASFHLSFLFFSSTTHVVHPPCAVSVALFHITIEVFDVSLPCMRVTHFCLSCQMMYD